MTNFEHYKDEILEIIDTSEVCIALSEKGNLCTCSDIRCADCAWKTIENCSNNMLKWLYEEHIEKPKLTSREKSILDFIKESNGVEGYIARDEDCKSLHYYSDKPYKACFDYMWDNDTGESMELSCDLLGVKFDFIKWEDEKPWKVEDLLKLEVE